MTLSNNENNSISLERHMNAMKELEKKLTDQFKKDINLLKKKLTVSNSSTKILRADNFIKTKRKVNPLLTKVINNQVKEIKFLKREVKSLEKAHKKHKSTVGKIYNPFTKRWIKKDGKIASSLPDTVKESWDSIIKAEEETEQWEKEILEEEERRKRVYMRIQLIEDGMKGNAQKWHIDGYGFLIPKVFLERTRDIVEELINSIEGAKKVNIVLTCVMKNVDPSNVEVILSESHFGSSTHRFISVDDTEENYDEMIEKVLENFEKYQKEGSGWLLHSIVNLSIYIAKYKPLKGGCKGKTKLPK